jgi:hypothetical protein
MDLKKELSKIKSKRNIVNTYVWTIDGGFYEDNTQVLESTQEVFNNGCDFTVGGGMGYSLEVGSGLAINHSFNVSNDNSLAVTRTKTKDSSTSWEVNVNLSLPTSPRIVQEFENGNVSFKTDLIDAGTVDAYRFMTFFLEPSAENCDDLFSKVVDPIWLQRQNDAYAKMFANMKNTDKQPYSWRIMHRVTYVSRIPQKNALKGSLEQKIKVNNIGSNYLLIKLLEPYVNTKVRAAEFDAQVKKAITNYLPEFTEFEQEIQEYMRDYYGIED